MSLELLLAHASDGQPVLRQGLSEEALQGVPIAPLEPPDRLWDASGDRESLSKQRWGLVVPKGEEGKRLLSLVEPLRKAREAEQGDVACVYEVEPHMDGPRSMRWKKQVFQNEDVIGEEERPRYLLLLGDLDQVSLELQQALSTNAFVGRLAFPSAEGYEAYVSKVLRWESMDARPSSARMLFYTARDGTDATESGHRGLIQPCLDACLKRQQAGSLPVAELREILDEPFAPSKRLLESTAQPGPGVLLSLSHGAWFPEGGGFSHDQRRALQGALMLPGKQRLTGAHLASGPFLPGGIWFCFACFSAGTPDRSSYTPWLQVLSKTDPEAARVLASLLPQQGERPFIAALPQAVLANPDGPLAVMGHVDLAWSCSFKDQGRRTSSRFYALLKALAEGRRAGNALRALLDFFNETNMELTAQHVHDAMEHQAGRQSFRDPLARAYLLLQRQDLLGYVLLGDPAVRLPISVSTRET